MNGNTKTMERSGASCVLIGSESLAIQCAEILLEKGLDLRAVVSAEARIAAWATAHGIPTFAPGKDLATRLRAIDHDYFLSITNLTMIGEEILALPRKAAINFHDGPLPRYAGMYTPAWALLHGATDYGITFHEMTLGADEGDLYVQRLFEIAPDDTSLTLNTRCYEAAIDAFGELVDRIREDRLEKRPQDLSERSYFGRHDRPPVAAILDWRLPSDELARSVRALDFGTYENAFASARLWHQGRLHLVRKAHEVDAEAAGGFGAAPGQILALDASGLTVACGDDTALCLADLTCPKGLPVSPEDLASRLALGIGDCLELVEPGQGAAIEMLAGRATRAEAFWVGRLARLEGPELPLRKAEIASATEPAANAPGLEIAAPPALAGRVDAWIAGFVAYLGRLCGRSRFDVSYAEPVLESAIGELSGLFATRVPLALEFDPGATAGDAVEAVGQSLARTRDRFSFFQDVVARHPKLARNPLLLSGGLSSVAVEIGADLDRVALPPGADVLLAIASGGDRARLFYDPRTLEAASANALVAAFQVFLEGFADPERPLRKIPLLAEPERRQVLRDWNDTVRDVPRDRCLHSLFDEAVARHPEDVAVVFEGQSLRYRELAARADALAHRLVARGIGPDQLVGIYLDRSIEMVVAVLGVLKAGGAYVPLDPNYPADRIAYMIEDSRARIVLSTRARRADLPACRAEVVLVDEAPNASETLAGPPSSTGVAPSHLAYVIYTSGSTGKPKGVMVEHRNVVNFFAAWTSGSRTDRARRGSRSPASRSTSRCSSCSGRCARGFSSWSCGPAKAEAGRGPRVRTRGLAADGLRCSTSGATMPGPGRASTELLLEAAKFGDRHGFRSVDPRAPLPRLRRSVPESRRCRAPRSPRSPAARSGRQRVSSRCTTRSASPRSGPSSTTSRAAASDLLRVGLAAQRLRDPARELRARQERDVRERSTQIVKRLWRGEAVDFANPHGKPSTIRTLPRPVQAELPSWITTPATRTRSGRPARSASTC
jgi:methionyl-tRNA formyltransferase